MRVSDQVARRIAAAFAAWHTEFRGMTRRARGRFARREWTGGQEDAAARLGSYSRWVGRLGPWQPEDWPGTEVDWDLAREAWGKGYATEGAAVAMDYAFDVLGWTEVVHTIEPANVASQAVARRLGSTILRQARMPAPFQDSVLDVWGQSREQWLARPRA